MRFSFRAWHAGANEMIPRRNQGFEGDVFNWVEEGQPVTVMQGLNITDINKKEMFEGDIITDHNGCGVIEYCHQYAAFRVNYKNGQCKWFYDYNLCGERWSVEVIGNIYENPDLIPGKA